MEQNQNGSKAYLISIVMVAVLGGLLFGYDTAVISGAEKGLQAFFKGASDFEYTDFMHGFTSSSALIGCIIGSALSGSSPVSWDVSARLFLRVSASSCLHGDQWNRRATSCHRESQTGLCLLFSTSIVSWVALVLVWLRLFVLCILEKSHQVIYVACW